MSHVKSFFKNVSEIAVTIDCEKIEKIADVLADVRARGGRLFFLGVGGSAANCSHAVNDFRKLCDIEAYSPVDNVAELTARTNDDGWDTVFSAWLRGSRACAKDAVWVFSVGGGDEKRNISANIVLALDEARSRGLTIIGVVGRDGGYTEKVGDVVLRIPTVDEKSVTPHAESFQSVVWHALSCHPKLMRVENKWEGLK
ncbi:MAG: sugar isomerase [Rhodospirillaceae bacterium]|nr:sugar isomerase [Rhodospirillaceae bacterium]|tara:strand:+ start:780 stop:1376 length:597 start_codon:yes stop_codon:yes gene_type:complete